MKVFNILSIIFSILTIVIIIYVIFLILVFLNYKNKKIHIVDSLDKIKKYKNYKINKDNYSLLCLSGGGTKGIVAIYLLRYKLLNPYIENDNIDIFDKFDGFSGVSIGAIISAGICARKNIIKNLVNNNLKEFYSFRKHFKYNKKDSDNVIKKIKDNTYINYSKLILEFLIYIINEFSNTILKIDLTDKIKNPFGIIIPSFDNNKRIHFFDKYFHVRFEDLEQDLFISTTHIDGKDIVISNHNKDNNSLASKLWLSEAIIMSSSAIPYFPSYKECIDGGFFSNDNILQVLELLYKESKIIPKNIINISLKMKLEKDTNTSYGGMIQNLVFDLDILFSSQDLITNTTVNYINDIIKSYNPSKSINIITLEPISNYNSINAFDPALIPYLFKISSKYKLSKENKNKINIILNNNSLSQYKYNI